jgi:GNAT superfamily N-acetyltransferase
MPAADLTISLRTAPRAADAEAVREIVVSTGFFSRDEIEIALELIGDAVQRGRDSHYDFVFADDADSGRTVGFACFGRVPCTQQSFDLYWIAVHNELRGTGIGSRLLAEAERLIADDIERGEGSRRIYVETSSRPQYEPTRAFYLSRGYAVDAMQNDFYAPGDGKVTLVKVVG